MSREERIAKLEKNLFYLSMKDRWNREDYELDKAWRAELTKLVKEEH